MRQVVWSVVACWNRSDYPVGCELQQLMARVVDVGYVLLDTFDDDAHRALTRLLTRGNVNVVRVHELVD